MFRNRPDLGKSRVYAESEKGKIGIRVEDSREGSAGFYLDVYNKQGFDDSELARHHWKLDISDGVTNPCYMLANRLDAQEAMAAMQALFKELYRQGWKIKILPSCPEYLIRAVVTQAGEGHPELNTIMVATSIRLEVMKVSQERLEKDKEQAEETLGALSAAVYQVYQDEAIRTLAP